jgi:hypothetical protein
MTLATEAAVSGRKPVQFCVLRMDYCTRTYGESPCTAGNVDVSIADTALLVEYPTPYTLNNWTSIEPTTNRSLADYPELDGFIVGGAVAGAQSVSAGVVISVGVDLPVVGIFLDDDMAGGFNVTAFFCDGDVTGDISDPDAYTVEYTYYDGTPKCFNTRKTCQDTANYDAGVFEYRFVESVQDRGITDIVSAAGLEGFTEGIPSLRGVQIRPTHLKPGFGLSERGRVEIAIQDHPHTDQGIDPYLSSRSYDPYTQGTFWRKWLARNPYYSGRLLKLYSGYITSPLSLDNFEVRTYQMESISGPDSSGRVQIVARDILGMIDSEKAVAPAASTGVLSADVDASATSATLSPTGVGDSEYPASGTVRIGSEVCTFTRSGDVLTIARGQDGSEASAHSAGDSVQLCLQYTARDIADVLYELLVTYAEVPASYIDTSDWADQVDTFLPGHVCTALITEPTGVRDLIDEICRAYLLDIWWDEVDNEVKLKALAPPEQLPDLLTDDGNIIAGSFTQRELADKRRSQIWVFYGQRDPTKSATEDSNYSTLYIAADADAESAVEYDQSRIEKIYSRWYSSAADAQRAGVRMRARLRDTPKELACSLDAKDLAYRTGDNVRLDTQYIVDETGANQEITVKITRQQWQQQGHSLAITAIDESFYGRYARMGPAGMAGYSSATDADKAYYGYMSETSAPFFPDGTEQYKVV